MINKNDKKQGLSQIARRLEWRLSRWTTVKGTTQINEPKQESASTHCPACAQRRSARPNMGLLPDPAKSSNRYLLHSFTPVYNRDPPPLLLLAWIVLGIFFWYHNHVLVKVLKFLLWYKLLIIILKD